MFRGIACTAHHNGAQLRDGGVGSVRQGIAAVSLPLNLQGGLTQELCKTLVKAMNSLQARGLKAIGLGGRE